MDDVDVELADAELEAEERPVGVVLAAQEWAQRKGHIKVRPRAGSQRGAFAQRGPNWQIVKGHMARTSPGFAVDKLMTEAEYDAMVASVYGLVIAG